MTRSMPAVRLQFEEVYAEHADFVWRTLHRLGTRASELPDVFQEVFVVVHRKLDSYDGQCRLTTWLFGISMRVVKSYRRRAYFRREQLGDEHGEDLAPLSDDNPEETIALRQARRQLDALLDQLDIDKRAVFVMFEIDGLPCDEIAEITGVPVGTVYSRLHFARKSFAKALARRQVSRLGGLT